MGVIVTVRDRLDFYAIWWDLSSDFNSSEHLRFLKNLDYFIAEGDSENPSTSSWGD